MGFLDKIFGKGSVPKSEPSRRGYVTTSKIEITSANYEKISNSYIAFDTETTGLSCDNDRIVELGAVLFQEGRKIKQFGTLVNPGISIPPQATAVNHITNEMLKSAPREQQAYSEFYRFFEGALSGDMVVCAHNATFDMNFLSKTLERLGYSGTIKYVDTLSLSRKLVKGLPNYKQPTVASHFGYVNSVEHRAVSDAEICGMIFNSLLQLKQQEVEAERISFEKKIPLEAEIEYCAYIQKIMVNAGAKSDWIKFYRNSASYIDVAYLYELFKFKMAKKGNYIIIGKSRIPADLSLETEACTATEGGDSVMRVFFKKPTDLNELLPFMMSRYNEVAPMAIEYIDNHMAEIEATYGNWFSISDVEIEGYLEKGALRRETEETEILRQEQMKKFAEAEKQAKREATKKKKEEKLNDNAGKTTNRASRPILQMDDDMNIIRRFESLSEAINETGINSKSIRDAAKGVQKHAGGFVWRYVDEYQN